MAPAQVRHRVQPSATSPRTTCSRWRRCVSDCGSDTVERFAPGDLGSADEIDRPPVGPRCAVWTRIGSTRLAIPQRARTGWRRSASGFLVLACFRRVHRHAAAQAHADRGAALSVDPHLLANLHRDTSEEELISFKLAHAEEVTVTITDSAGRHRRPRSVRDRPVARYKQFSPALERPARNGVHPHGRHRPGRAPTIVTPSTPARLPPQGNINVRVYLREQRRAVLSPTGFTLVRP